MELAYSKEEFIAKLIDSIQISNVSYKFTLKEVAHVAITIHDNLKLNCNPKLVVYEKAKYCINPISGNVNTIQSSNANKSRKVGRLPNIRLKPLQQKDR